MGVSLLLENTSQDFKFSLYLSESWFLPLLLVVVLAALLLLMVVPAIPLLLTTVAPVALPLAVLDAPSKVFPA